MYTGTMYVECTNSEKIEHLAIKEIEFMSARAIKCKLHDALEDTVSVENDTTIKEESKLTSDELALFYEI